MKYVLMEENKWRKNFFIEILFKIFGGISYYFSGKMTYEGSLNSRILEYVFTNNKTVIIDTENKILTINEYDVNKEIREEDIKKIILRKHSIYNAERFSIDIYDNDLNAYECFDTYSCEKAESAIVKLEKTFGYQVEDKTEKNDYEGFRKRII